MNQQEKLLQLQSQNPRQWMTARPHLTRRGLFQVAGAALTGSYLTLNPQYLRAQAPVKVTSQPVTPINKAKNVVFVLLTGAPSHTDTWDLKMVNGVTPKEFAPAVINGMNFPAGLYPNLAKKLPDLCVARSVRSWALVHTLAQTWNQIGRNPAAALGDIAPHIGSVVALELEAQRRPDQVFPTFLALNANGCSGPGYFPGLYAPFKVTPSANGLLNTTNSEGQARADQMYSRLRAIDDPLRTSSPLGKDVADYDAFYKSARGLMYNSKVDAAFKLNTADMARYGSSSLGNAFLTAKQVLSQGQGTRFIQINYGNWDMHIDIYGADDPTGNNLFTLGKPFDTGLATFIDDLKSSGLWNDTLLVVGGEFGRTVGALSAAKGRDHYVQQFCVFGGAGIRGGRPLGATNADGTDTVDYGWSRQRYIRPEDIEATIYSALGINWTTTRYDDPFGRGFEYVPFADQDLYGPVNELWK